MVMADVPGDPDARGPGTPRWVKALGIATIVVVVLVVVVMLVAGGQHGPGRHTAPSDAGAPTPTAS
jgi:hypothetical protein